MKKSYLGDSVYVELIDGMLKLTTENGNGASNIIYIDHEVWHNLQAYVITLEIENKSNEKYS